MLQQLLLTGHIFGAESTGSSGGIGALGVDLKSLILQIVTFLIVFWLLKRFAFEKIVKVLEDRRDTVNQGVKLGQEMAKEKAELEARIAEMLRQARVEADKIIAAGHNDAGQLIKEAEAAAARKTDAMLADAHARIEDDIERARKGLEKKMLALVAEATEVVIGERLDPEKDARLIEGAIRKAEVR